MGDRDGRISCWGYDCPGGIIYYLSLGKDQGLADDLLLQHQLLQFLAIEHLKDSFRRFHPSDMSSAPKLGQFPWYSVVPEGTNLQVRRKRPKGIQADKQPASPNKHDSLLHKHNICDASRLH